MTEEIFKVLRYFKDLLLSIRLIMFNHFINRIPFSSIRIPLMKLYIEIGENTNVMCNVIIYNKGINRGQIKIGSNCVINRDCLLDGRKGKLIIGDNVDIARGVWIFTMEHDPNSDTHQDAFGDVIIEDYVWIASRATILPDVRIGRGAVVAAGAVVTKNVLNMKVVGGVPAKEISERISKLNYKLHHFPLFDY